MAEDRTLLAHLTLKFATSPEDIATEALRHILESSATARRAFQELLREGGAEVGLIPRVHTQAGDAEGRFPDLAAFDEQGAERVLVESKFWAGLTKNQPVPYLWRLPQDRPTALLFVAPAMRRDRLWDELRNRVVKAGIELGATYETLELRSAGAGGKRRLMLTSWTALLDRIAREANAESKTLTDIRQLRGLTDHMDGDAFLPLRPSELGPEFARRMLGLQRLIDRAAQHGKENAWINLNGVAVTPRATGYGRYMKLGGVGGWAGVWFGIDCGLWAGRRATPLWLQFYGRSPGWKSPLPLDEIRRRLGALRTEDPPGLIDIDSDVFAPINLSTGVEQEVVFDAVVARLKHIAGLIGQSGDPEHDAQPAPSGHTDTEA